ncbi:winged helix family transcriptional regulator [Arenibacter sp. N53]|uniref:winged helix-turn-helix domain-containing protein n=1 Tax=Arenibacter TaxID=178469 RepID=UPI000CD41EA4|nr:MULTISPECIES: winged helix-turn-helix domain-containing protein [Arenibacter]MCM4152576.1 winged helix family transcriptional regulator [Arenibacter sp. N53]
MKKERFLTPIVLMVFISFTLLGYIGFEENDNFSQRAKIALRDSGNKLLLSVGDSTSLIMPVMELDENTFELSFQNKVQIEPGSLMSILGQSLVDADLPNSYIVEVIENVSGEVAHSYEIKSYIEESIITCIGRNLPFDYYKIKIHFTGERTILKLDRDYSLLPLVLIGFVGCGLLYWKNGKHNASKVAVSRFSKIGNYRFYKEQNKLVKGNITIELTAKECELISIFSEKPNQIIKRDLLIKEVWEDNGVFVGRSLDTFISKIRKKFQDDDSINFVTVHGVGYKLKIS